MSEARFFVALLLRMTSEGVPLILTFQLHLCILTFDFGLQPSFAPLVMLDRAIALLDADCR
jgi:hypothetical protein